MNVNSFDFDVKVGSVRQAEIILYRLNFVPQESGYWHRSIGFRADIANDGKIHFSYDDNKPSRGKKPSMESIEKAVRKEEKAMARQLAEMLEDSGLASEMAKLEAHQTAD